MRDILKDGAESRQGIKDSEALQELLPSPGLRGGKERLVNWKWRGPPIGVVVLGGRTQLFLSGSKGPGE